MKRPYIDQAIHAKLNRLTAFLRFLERKGGTAHWLSFHPEGIHHTTVAAAVRQDYARRIGIVSETVEITEAGRRYLADIEAAAMQEQ